MDIQCGLDSTENWIHDTGASCSEWVKRGLVTGLCYTCLTLSLLVVPMSAWSASFDVLWYSYAEEGSRYKNSISSLAGDAHTWSQGDGHSWNLTYFGPSEPTPVFSNYDVLVIHSAESFWTENGPGRITPDFSGILNNKQAIESARGTRTVLSGSDLDFHAAKGDTGHTGRHIPDYNQWDGAIGSMINSVNWVAEGDGLGIVSFYHGEHGPNAYWWTDQDSFLKDELDSYVADFYADFGQRDDYPIITPGAENHALNDGLTNEGLGGWFWSSHGGFARDIPGYDGLQESVQHPDYFVTIATSLIPVPAALPLFSTGLLLLIGIRRSRLFSQVSG